MNRLQAVQGNYNLNMWSIVTTLLFQQTTLAEVVEQFEDRLCHHQQFWDVMDELDRKTWVLEPENPTPACNYRRIVIGKTYW